MGLGHHRGSLPTLGYGPEHYEDFVTAYGYDVTTLAGYPTLRDLRELRMVTTNAREVHHAPESIDEVLRLVYGLENEDLGMRWRTL
ncbi:hypothetical protein [Streptomyces alfalfae]